MIGHSQINTRGHTSGQAIGYDLVQGVSPVVSWLCDVLVKIQAV